MNRAYELGFIIPVSVQEADTHAVVEQVQQWIKDLGGAVTKVDFWGRRRLAYAIQDFREGYYVFLQLEFPPLQLAELERSLRYSDKIIRHLVVRLDE